METVDNTLKKDCNTFTQSIIDATEGLCLANNEAVPQKICNFYSKFEYCKFGSKCKFLHLKKNRASTYKQNKYSDQACEIAENAHKIISPHYEDKNQKQIPCSTSNCYKNPITFKKSCRYFKAGYCSNGTKCKYEHSIEKCTSISNNLFHTSNPVQPSIPLSTKRHSVPLCHYFKKGFCHNGDHCKYYHMQNYIPSRNSKIQTKRVSRENSQNQQKHAPLQSHVQPKCVATENSSIQQKCVPVENLDIQTSCILVEDLRLQQKCSSIENSNVQSKYVPKEYPDAQQKCASGETSDIILNGCTISGINLNHPKEIQNSISCNDSNCIIVREKKIIVNVNSFDLSTLLEDDLHQLRCTEITQMKKRFPNCKIDDKAQIFSVEFQPTDPDWPHDVANFQLQITFPENYPLEICEIVILPHPCYIPEITLSHLNQCIYDWLNGRHKLSIELNKVELLFRPFLRWLDKNLNELFSGGLKKAQQNIFSNSDNSEILPIEKLSSENDTFDGLIKPENCASLLEEVNSSEVQVPQEEKTYQNDSSAHLKSQNSSFYLAQKLGVNILFKNLEFVEGVAALSCTKLAIMLHCARCKTSCNIKTLPNKSNSVACTKCGKNMECNFNASIMHQYSNVLGTIYLVECQGVDVNLVECAFLADCLNCSKQVPLQGLHYGSKQKLWCTFCNQKLILSIESSKFQASSHSSTTIKTTPVKKIEKKKDPVIKEGIPLPEFGACKHYKKSNRWLRFPCCGRVYPCDICHEEKEIDHEMKFASRMICGFCSKEQPYSKDKPCSSCSSNVTSKSGTHWEGGKGCRNKIKMARDDKKKYAGRSKTISKKSQNAGKKKK